MTFLAFLTLMAAALITTLLVQIRFNRSNRGYVELNVQNLSNVNASIRTINSPERNLPAKEGYNYPPTIPPIWPAFGDDCATVYVRMRICSDLNNARVIETPELARAIYLAEDGDKQASCNRSEPPDDGEKPFQFPPSSTGKPGMRRTHRRAA